MNFTIIDDCGKIYDASDKVLIEDDKITLTTDLHEDMNQLINQVLMYRSESINLISHSNDWKKWVFYLKK